MRIVGVAPAARRHQAGVSDQQLTHTTVSAFMASIRPNEISRNIVTAYDAGWLDVAEQVAFGAMIA